MKKIILIYLFCLSFLYGGDLKEAKDAYLKGDHLKAQSLFKKVCYEHSQEGCIYLYKILCDSDTIWCRDLANIYKEKYGLNESKVKVYYKKACNGGDARSCAVIAEMYYESAVLKKDYVKAYLLMKKSCDNGISEACTFLGNEYFEGEDLKHDYKKAYSFFKKACYNFDYKGCRLLGKMYQEGLGVKQDKVKAELLYKKACNENGHHGNGDNKGCALFHEMTCFNGDMIGCYQAGKFYYDGKGVNADHLKAEALSKKACDNGAIQGCITLGQIYENKQIDINKSIYYYKKACTDKISFSCYTLGFFYENKIYPANIDKAKYYYKKACYGSMGKQKHRLSGCIGYLNIQEKKEDNTSYILNYDEVDNSSYIFNNDDDNAKYIFIEDNISYIYMKAFF